MRVIAQPAYKNREKNPYNYLLYSHLIRRHVVVDEFAPSKMLPSRYQVWHLHWPDTMLSDRHTGIVVANVVAFSGLATQARLRGTKLIWTLHNLFPHEQLAPWKNIWFREFFLRHVDGVIALSESGAAQARERFPQLESTPMVVIPHGHYIDMYPNIIGREAARARLGLTNDNRALLFFGKIRPYKNVSHLIRVFGQVEDVHLRLIIAGHPADDAIRTEIEHLALSDKRVLLFLDFVSDDEVQVFLNAADLVVLPYREILNSGTALLSLSFRKAVLVPNRGAMAELQSRFGEGVVHTFDGDLNPSTLVNAMSASIAYPVPADEIERQVRHDLDWDAIADQTLAFYRAVCETVVR